MNDKIRIINNWNIQNVFYELENGNMKIPRFQRGYVWERSKIVKLLNSIYEEHPIGSFFVWEASSDYKNLCREIPGIELRSTQEKSFDFIIDGQQRITSLYVALKGKKIDNVDYSTICFNLDRKCFVVPKLKTEKNNIPTCDIFNQDKLSAWIEDYVTNDKENGLTYMKTLNNCKRILDNYPISIIKTLNVDLDEAITIFETINQAGKRLSLFDLVHASVWSKDFDLRSLIKTFNNEPAISLFGGLQPETFTQSLSLNAIGNCQKTSQLKLTASDCLRVWDRTLDCLRLAIDFVKGYGAQRIDILPYENIIPVIQYYYFMSNKKFMDPIIKPLIDDWFWTTVFSRRYSSSTLTRMKEDADWILRLIEGHIETRLFRIALSYKDLRSIQMKNRSVVKDGVLCILASNTPVDFDNGQEVTLDNTNASRANAKENHHFFPYSRTNDFKISQNDVNSLLNFAFISKKLNQSISNKLPSVYLSEYAEKNHNIEKMLETHFIDYKAYHEALHNNFENFVQARGNLILDKINSLCKVNMASQTITTIIDEELDTSDDIDNESITED